MANEVTVVNHSLTLIRELCRPLTKGNREYVGKLRLVVVGVRLIRYRDAFKHKYFCEFDQRYL